MNAPKTTSKKPFLRKAATALLWLALWVAAAALVGRDLLLPGPVATLRALLTLAGKASFWLGCAATMFRIVAGFVLGMAAGALLGALSWRFAFCRDFIAPMIAVVKATPVASFILLALVWLRVNNVPAFTAMLIVMPIAFANVSGGLSAMDANLSEMADAFGMRAAARLKYICLPQLAPYLRAAVATGMGMAWKSGVAAEVLCTPKFSLGATMYSAKVYLETPTLLAATAVVIALSMLLEKAVLGLIHLRERGRAGA